MKVIILTRAIYPLHGYGGMEKYYFNLSKSLARLGIKVEVVTTIASSSYRNKYKCVKCIKYVVLPPNFNRKHLSKYLLYYIFSLNAYNYIKKEQFDVVHGTGGLYPYVKYKYRKPVVFQPFGLENIKSKGLSKFLYYTLSHYPNNQIFKLADAIASEGEIQTKEIIQLFGVPKEKIFYLPDGVDLDEIEEYIENVEVTREDYNFQDADIVLMNVNRLEPNKGVQYLIEALKILNQELNVKLILVGAGSEEEKIKRLIKHLGLSEKVKHFKNISDKLMFQLYTLADISVTPTLYEGLPLVVLEAMACGKPIVASNVSEVPQAVKDGINGFLVPPRNPKAIADAVLKIYDKNLFMKMGKASKEIVKNYDWSRIAKMAIRKYEELIGR